MRQRTLEFKSPKIEGKVTESQNNYLFYFCKIAFIDQGSHIKTESVSSSVFMWPEVNKGNLQK